MKKSEAIKLIDNLSYAIHKLRSNAKEAVGSDTEAGKRVLKDLYPELFTEDNPAKLTVFNAITKAKEISDNDVVEPLTIYNLVYLIDRKFPELQYFTPLIGFYIPELSLNLCKQFEQE